MLLAKPKFRAVIFDLDGTLVKMKFRWKESRLAMINWLDKNGFDISGLDDDSKSQVILDRARIESESNPNLPRFDHVRKSLIDIVQMLELESSAEATAYEGSLILLKILKERGILSAVVTNAGRAPVEKVLEKLGFLPYLVTVVTRDELLMLKPEPEGIRKVLGTLNLDKADVIYVGDAIEDMEAARNAGVAYVALTGGLHSANLLIEKEPDYVISSIEEMKELI
ncbi:MAG: HAD family hydrolase [archaeon]|nr:HAD family hydrolase [archaeon]